MPPARYTVTSRDIDDEHRPRIVRRAPGIPIPSRAPSRPIAVVRQSRARVLLGFVLAAPAVLLLFLFLRWEAPESASSSALSKAGARSEGLPVAGGSTLAAAAAPGATAGNPLLPWVSSGGAGDAAPGLAGATEAPAVGAASTPAPGRNPPSAGDLPQPGAGGEGLAADAPAAAPPHVAPSAEHRRTAPEASARRSLVLQLSSYADEPRARRVAGALDRSLRNLLKGARVRTERAQVHGKAMWRVVAGPVVGREHGERLCAALRRSGQSCIVTMLR